MKKGIQKPSESKRLGRLSALCKRARIISLTATAAAIAVMAAIFVFDLADDALALTRHSGETRSVTVTELIDLPAALKSEGLIKHPLAFSIYLSLSGKELRRETASVSPDMDYRALLSAFTDEPKRRTVRITIPKNASVAEIIDIFVGHGIGSREGFVAAVNSQAYDYGFLADIPEDRAPYRLEGYLYPDTYDFYAGMDEGYYINKLLDRFSRVTDELLPLCQSLGIPLDRAVTIASLIECSAGYASGYEQMSSVIHNRLDACLPLEIPATAVYAVSGRGQLFAGLPDETLTSVDSPYNTYKNTGLPPGPICCPTKEALLCALSPRRDGYLYFTTLPSGRVLFAKTEKEHRRNLAQNR